MSKNSKDRVDISRQLSRLAQGRTVLFARDLIEYLGHVTEYTVIDWIYGDCRVTMERVEKIAAYFGVSVQDFMDNRAPVRLPWAQRVLVAEGYLTSVEDCTEAVRLSFPYRDKAGRWVQG